MNRLAHRVVAAKRKRHVADAAADQRVWQGTLYRARGIHEVHGIVVVLFDTGCDGKNIRVENNIFRREPGLLD